MSKRIDEEQIMTYVLSTFFLCSTEEGRHVSRVHGRSRRIGVNHVVHRHDRGLGPGAVDVVMAAVHCGAEMASDGGHVALGFARSRAGANQAAQ
jgi:hypothetical protein